MMQLVRQKSFSYGLLKPLSQKRGFFFSLQVGFSKPLDPLSGMTVNLAEVDHWLQQFIDALESSEKPIFVFQDPQLQAQMHANFILFQAVDFLRTQSALVQAELTQVRLIEERHWAVAWNNELAVGESLFESLHYLENFVGSRTDLLKVRLTWSKGVSDSFAFSHESVNLLKSISRDKIQAIELGSDWGAEFKKLLGHPLSSSACVVGVEVESLAGGWKLLF